MATYHILFRDGTQHSIQADHCTQAPGVVTFQDSNDETVAELQMEDVRLLERHAPVVAEINVKTPDTAGVEYAIDHLRNWVRRQRD